MARIRAIKPKFFLNEVLSELPFSTRLFFIGLWTLADRDGRLEDRPKRIKAELFPYDNIDVDKELTRLHDAGFVIRYKVNANRSFEDIDSRAANTDMNLIQIKNWNKHQKIDKANESSSELPEPPIEIYKEECQTFKEQDEKKTSYSLALAIGKEGKGKEGKGKEFIPPNLEEVKSYFKENGFREEIAEKAFRGYDDANWHDSKGNKVKNWKQKMNFVWFTEENKIKVNQGIPFQNQNQKQSYLPSSKKLD